LLEEVESLLRQYAFGTFDSKSTQNCWEEINSLFSLSADIHISWRSNSISSQTLDSDEDKRIIEKLPGLNAIGYREVIDFLLWIKTLPEAIEAVQTNSRHYAKRQLTWFRRYQTEKIDGFFGA
jgi:tRNA A37 N6-isopentenylltransferase MiaA